MAEFAVRKIMELSKRDILAVDNFIINQNTNGEFINTIRYLSYHPEGKFQDDSICIQEKGSGNIVGVMMAAIDSHDRDCVVSHPGTTFAGPIIKRNINIQQSMRLLKHIIDYYESKYKKIIVRTAPIIFGKQPNAVIDYFLFLNGYKNEITGLSNVIDITGITCEDDVIEIFDGKRRNKLRKNLREKRFIISEENRIDQRVWDAINQNLELKFSTNTTHTWSEITDLVNRFPKEIDVYYANDMGGCYGAFALNYRFKNVYHTQYLGLNYEKAQQNPNVFLVYQLIINAWEQGFRYFSFGASTENRGRYLNPGLYEYKAGYGGGEIILSEWSKRETK